MSKEDLVTDSDENGRQGEGEGSVFPKRSKKRKRDDKTFSELEVDTTAPEPPSKKALRKSKKAKIATSTLVQNSSVAEEKEPDHAVDQPEITPKRSDYGIWIGNLAWTTSKEELRKFITDNANIEDADVTRIHIPAPKKGATETTRRKIMPENKGFAYVDFSSADACKSAIDLSESMLSGRKLLIKDAKSFEGRPDPVKTKEQNSKSTPNRRIFVGNLEFDTSENDLRGHFSPCGEIDMVFMATFEDTAKCKGYAWVTFREVESAENAIRGWVGKEEEQSAEEGSDSESKATKKRKKPRKWWVNRLNGRNLRMEFAEDQTTRYKKRFGKSRESDAGAEVGNIVQDVLDEPRKREPQRFPKRDQAPKLQTEYKSNKPRSSTARAKPSVDARTIKPGAALALAPRQTGAIVQGQGKKVVFD